MKDELMQILEKLEQAIRERDAAQPKEAPADAAKPDATQQDAAHRDAPPPDVYREADDPVEDLVVEEEHLVTVGYNEDDHGVNITYSTGQNEYQVAAALLTAAALILPTRVPLEEELCDQLFDLAEMYFDVGEDDD